ncbi:N-acetylmuramoyl-L-alanine amidase [bacterium]|nr:N-acetylmuramoyl-L-alanine amidase [bacterium]
MTAHEHIEHIDASTLLGATGRRLVLTGALGLALAGLSMQSIPTAALAQEPQESQSADAGKDADSPVPSDAAATAEPAEDPAAAPAAGSDEADAQQPAQAVTSQADGYVTVPLDNLLNAGLLGDASESGAADGTGEVGARQAGSESTPESMAAPETGAPDGAQASAAVEAPAIGFVYVDMSRIEAGQTQSIAVVFDDESLALTSATLTYATSDGSTFQVGATAIAGNAALFQFAPLWSDTYTLLGVDLTAAGLVDSDGSELALTSSLVAEGASPCTFEATGAGFDLGARMLMASAVAAPYAGSAAQGEATTTFTLDAGDEMLEASDLATSLVRAVGATGSSVFTLGDDGILTVALDPGHGGYDSGAVGVGGMLEKDANWSIALYAKAALEKIPGVRVVLTRSENECPEINTRAQVARDANADVYVSIHNNSADNSPAANGCEVYYPNPTSTWKYAETSVPGEQLAEAIQDKLTALGLADRGIATRILTPSQEGIDRYGNSYGYPDDPTDVGDYYALIRYPRLYGIPAVVVEHAFVTNPDDASKLTSDTWLRAMGEADAQAILDCYAEVLTPADPNGGTEQHIGDGWYYVFPDGTQAVSEFLDLGSKTVYYGDDGAMLYGEQQIDGAWYYFDTWDGHMATGLTTLPDGRTVYYGTDGAMRYGEQNVDGAWRYFDTWDGHMVTGITEIPDNLLGGTKTVYYDAEGAMAHGEAHIGDGWYYFDTWDGHMATGLTVLPDGRTVYYGTDGAMRYGWQEIDGARRYFDTWDGHMATGLTWIGSASYLFDSDGAIVRGEAHVDGAWRYFDPTDGHMATGFTSVPDNLNGGTKMVFYGPDGAMRYGEQHIGDGWYYFDTWDGHMATGLTTLPDGRRVLYGDDGAMRYGWQRVSGRWCNFDTWDGHLLASMSADFAGHTPDASWMPDIPSITGTNA